jgi:hypothetical protein
MQQHDYVLQLTAENSSVPFCLYVGPAQESVGVKSAGEKTRGADNRKVICRIVFSSSGCLSVLILIIESGCEVNSKR